MILVRLEMVLSLLMIILESIVTGAMNNLFQYFRSFSIFSHLGTGVWVGGLGIIAAGLGWRAFISPRGYSKCLMMANFVLCIFCAVADGILIIFAIFCLHALPYMEPESYKWNTERQRFVKTESTPDTLAMAQALVACEVFLLLAAFVHFVSTITSTALMCRHLCEKRQPAVAVVYLPGCHPNLGGIEPADMAVPSNVQVIFVPTVPGGGQDALHSEAVVSARTTTVRI